MKSVAIGIPVYNGSSYIEQALNSVYLQGDSSWFQVVVVDDCFTDDTVEVVKRWLLERDIKQRFASGSAQTLMINLVLAKYCLLPYQSVVCWRGISLSRHRLVHSTMKQAGFYPITAQFSHAFFQRLVSMINRSIWLFYSYYWLRLVKNFIASKFGR